MTGIMRMGGLIHFRVLAALAGIGYLKPRAGRPN